MPLSDRSSARRFTAGQIASERASVSVWRCFVALLVSLSCLAEVPAQAPTSEKAVSPEIARLIVDLESPEYEKRRAATEQLGRLGRAAIAPAVEAARTGSLEASVRAVAVLREIYATSEDAPTIDAAEAALVQLTQASPPSVASRAQRTLDDNYAVAERRAVEEIKKLGGVTLIDDQPAVRGVTMIQIGRNWTGGDKGLEQLKRLRYLRTLRIVGKPENAGISEEAIDGLLAALPNVMRVDRGEAKLGVAGLNREGCVVDSLEPDGAAEQAGMRANDTIVQFDGKPVTTFDSLVKHIWEKSPGDKVPVTVIRNGREITLEATLHGWVDKPPKAKAK